MKIFYSLLFMVLPFLLGGCRTPFLEYQEPTLKNTIKLTSGPGNPANVPVPLSDVIKKITATELKLPAVKSSPIWTLTAGKTIGHDLNTWGEKAGWKVIWTMPKDWVTPSTTEFQGDFQAAATEVIRTLAANGAFVHAQFYVKNKTMVVTGAGVTPQ